MADTYFSYFGNVVINGVPLKNLWNELRFNDKFRNIENILIDYNISSADTPETISYRYYDDKNLFWIVLIINDIQDYFHDWPLREEELRKLANLLAVADDNTRTDGPNKTETEIYLELYDENELKRAIKILNPQFLQQFLFEVNKTKV